MDNVITIGAAPSLAGLRSGDDTIVRFNDGSTGYFIFNDITRYGIEVFDKAFESKPLTFIPFTAIKKVRKATDED